MDTNSYILGKSVLVVDVGEIYPIIVEDYDTFAECSSVLQIRKEHFIDKVKDMNLLDLIVFGMRETDVRFRLEQLFTLVFRQPVSYVQEGDLYAFLIDDDHIITGNNYDEIRNIIMKQNLIFEQKIYKNKMMQDWADKVLQARMKNGIKMEFEDMLSTVSVFAGKHYWDLAKYTIYQLKSDFNRISKFKNFDTGVIAAANGSDKKIEHYAENLDMHKSPYDDVFVDSSKLKKLDTALK